MAKGNMSNKKEKNVSKNLPRICLNMIVRDEAHIITETLDCVAKYINYYVISDTGSEDNTIELIKTYFEKAGIPGEVFSDKWKNFGYNRTLALKHCRGKSEYVWVIDADDIIRGNFKFPKDMTADCYTMTYGQGFTYHRAQVFRNNLGFNWRYVGVLHEYPDCDQQCEKSHIDGDYYVDSRRLGARSKDPEKYKKDALVLEEGLIDEPKNERYMFYLAQSWFDYGDIEKGIECYKKRIAAGGWYEEVYYSYYRIAQGLTILKKPWVAIEQAYLDTYRYCKDRAEPLYQIAMHYRLQNDFKTAYEWAKKASKIPYPDHCILFIFRDIYDYKILDELSINCYYIGQYAECYNVCQKLLEVPTLPEDMKPRVRQNMEYAQTMLQNQKRKIAVVYVGNSFMGYDTILASLMDSLKESFQVLLVSEHIARDQSDIVYMNCNQYEKYQLNIEPSIVFLYDNINFLIKHNTEAPVILIQLDEQFKLTFSNGLKINITNQELVSEYLSKVTSVVCYNEELYYNLKDNIGLGQSVLCLDTTGVNDFTMFSEEKLKIEPQIENKDVEHNGFEHFYPDSYSKIWDNRQANEYYDGMLSDFHFDNIKTISHLPELVGNLAELYAKFEEYSLAKQFFEKAIHMTGKREDAGYSTYRYLLKVKLAECLLREEKYQEAFDICHEALEKEQIPESMRDHILKVRDKNIEYIKDKYLAYPKDKIDFLVDKSKQKNNHHVMVSVTSCKRFDLFEKTVNSFINCCKDLELIDRWLCVDDNSSKEDRKKMREKYPFFNFVFKNESQKGHANSMNIIYDYAQEYKYLLHMEDDFHFAVAQSYVSKASLILDHDAKIGQVLFNKNYSEVEFSQVFIKGGIVKHTADGIRYVEHEHYKDGTPEYKAYLEKYKNSSTNGYWPHFSFRPSLMKVSMLKTVGPFYHTPHFEMQYADEYVTNGYISAFYDTFSAIHIGKKTWEKTTANAYNLNQTEQFSMDSKTLITYVLSNSTTDNLDSWKNFKTSAKGKLYSFIRQKLNNVQFLSDSQHNLFYQNSFNYRRDIIDSLVAQYEILWRDQNSEYLMIVDEKVALTDTFKNRLDKLLEQIVGKSYDFIALAYDGSDKPLSTELKEVDTFNHPISAYLISRQARQNFILWAEKDGFGGQLHEFVNKYQLKKYEYSLFIGKKKSEMRQLSVYPGYKFYSQMDSRGGDIHYVGNKTPDQMKQIAESTPECIGFNTLGWLKKEIKDEKEFIHLYLSTEINQGLYVMDKGVE
jgi:hypothetical protein